jgi:hypothetical protein
MNYIQSWNEIITISFQNVWSRIIVFIPELIGALIILVIGLLIAYLLSNLVYRLIAFTRIDEVIDRVPWIARLRQSGFKLKIAHLTAQIVKWFFIIVTLIAVADVLHLTQVNRFLDNVLLYIPNVIVAILILGIGILIAQFIADIVEKSARVSHIIAVMPLVEISRWSIIIFSTMAALVQLGIASSLIEILFTGLVAGAALAFGLAFGIGGKDKAREMLDKLSRSDITRQ